MSELHFAEPHWVHAFWAWIGFVGLLIWLERRGAGALDRLLSARLQPRLAVRAGPRRRQLRLGLLALCCALLIAALMRPQGEARRVAAPRVGAELMICLDVSRSMLAEDVAPNRLERAKAEIVDLLPYLRGNQVGLIAFAGRATVLSPLTPDFGFLRLVLESASPASVTRGGTRLEEPIRKAIAGFGPPGAASRAILLITDGEDQDSFPLDAAREAAELGIRIIAIGFGDELGSEVYVTDPRTGARSLLRDPSGRPVRSRLDGELLRELALATDGAYVPAGTGLLDLQSIYERHIARLMRGKLDALGKPVRRELYPWALLGALVCLLAGVALAGRGDLRRSVRLGLLLLGAAALPAGVAGAAPEALADSPASPAGTPRVAYNQGVAALSEGALDRAEKLLGGARRESREDAELRFRATYNLGWLAVKRADALEESDPRAAMGLLEEAADRFRDAVMQRPEHEDARVNLEVVLRRVLALADRLAQQDPEDLRQKLERLIGEQRSLLAEMAPAAQLTSADEDVSEPTRRRYRELATRERMLLAEVDALASEMARELDTLDGRLPEERSPEEELRRLQLEMALPPLHGARERMGQTRRQLRQRQGVRAYRRGAAALGELKRALDPLRDPLAALDALIPDAVAVAGVLEQLAPTEGPAESSRPAWLTRELAQELAAAVAERSSGLALRLEAAAGLPAASTPDEESLLRAFREAAPLVREATHRFESVAGALDAEVREDARAEQQAGVAALLEARERFLDLRGLIELSYATQRGLEEALRDVPQPPLPHDARRDALASLQQRNIERLERLEALLAQERARAEAVASAPQGEVDAERLRQRLARADEALARARREMQAAKAALDEAGRLAEAAPAAERAVAALASLRRLFLSLRERVADLHARQLELADRTRTSAAHPAPEEAPEIFGPLAALQRALGDESDAVALELEAQSRAAGGDLTAPDPEETTRRLREAGEHVLLAEEAMRSAEHALAARPPAPPDAFDPQETALSELASALELLTPPQQEPEPDGSQSDSGSGDGEGESPEAAPQAVDPAQLLQQVRDREAERRRARQRGQAGYESVERDW